MHASSFDGVLARGTKVESPSSKSLSKRKNCWRNISCCLSALIAELPARTAQANKTTCASLSKSNENVMPMMMAKIVIMLLPALYIGEEDLKGGMMIVQEGQRQQKQPVFPC